MKQRMAFALFLHFVVLLACVVLATWLQVNGTLNPTFWLRAHQETRTLWALDGFALYAFLAFALVGQRLTDRLRQQEEAKRVLQEEHHRQLDATVHNSERTEKINEEQSERLAQLETLNQNQAKQLEELEALRKEQAERLTQWEIEAQSGKEAFEAEARRLTEQAFRALSGQVEAQARQLDAVNLALQYHRAELTHLRHTVREAPSGLEPAEIARLSPAEINLLQGPYTRLVEGLDEEGPGAEKAQNPSPETLVAYAEETPPVASAGVISHEELASSEPVNQEEAADAPLVPDPASNPVLNSLPNSTRNAASTLIVETAEFDLNTPEAMEETPPPPVSESPVEAEEASSHILLPLQSAPFSPPEATSESQTLAAGAGGVSEAEYRMLLNNGATPEESADEVTTEAGKGANPPAARRGWRLRF